MKTDEQRRINLMRAYLAQENRKYPSDKMVAVPKEAWPRGFVERVEVWRSREFLVQVFPVEDALVRLSVNRTKIDRDGKFKGDITWDELQWIKSACGYGDRDALEVYPPDGDIVNVANMRHLWVHGPSVRIPWFWRTGKGSGAKSGDVAEAILGI